MEEAAVPVSVRRTCVMVLRTSASLSVSMYSDSFPAMKPQRTCPCLGRKDGAENCLDTLPLCHGPPVTQRRS